MRNISELLSHYAQLMQSQQENLLHVKRKNKLKKISPSVLKHKAHDLVFNTVHQRNLIYNMCWEDPRIDRALLQLDASSRVVVLTRCRL